VNVIWHDLECGGYAEDLPLWRELADREGDPVLDVGAGTGRVALDLARRGHSVTALDRDRELLAELQRRAAGLPVRAVIADARDFRLEQRFALCVVPMQTIQLLGGPAGRAGLLRCVRAQLAPGGLVAVALAEQLETYDSAGDWLAPLPDM
jgi:SAM-dependent methyltransferase